MVFTAKWRLVSIENAEAYHKAIHTPEEFLAKLRVLYAELQQGSSPDLYVEELTVDKAAGKVRRVVFIRGEQKRDSGLVSLNEEAEHSRMDGRVVKVKISLEGDDKLVLHEKGADFEATIELHLHGDELHVTLTSGAVVCKEKYKRL
jgi:hypothetical protein